MDGKRPLEYLLLMAKRDLEAIPVTKEEALFVEGTIAGLLQVVGAKQIILSASWGDDIGFHSYHADADIDQSKKEASLVAMMGVLCRKFMPMVKVKFYPRKL